VVCLSIAKTFCIGLVLNWCELIVRRIEPGRVTSDFGRRKKKSAQRSSGIFISSTVRRTSANKREQRLARKAIQILLGLLFSWSLDYNDCSGRQHTTRVVSDGSPELFGAGKVSSLLLLIVTAP